MFFQLCLAVAIPVAAAVTALEFGNAINMAGRQRMLTQRMSKEFFLVAQGYKVDDNKGNMAASVALFDSSLHKLMNGSANDGIPVAPTDEVLSELLTVLRMWMPFRARLEGNVYKDPIPRDALEYVRNNNVPLLKQANAAVTAFVKASTAAGIPGTGLQVDISGRQRMLSQRMSKEVLQIALRMDVENTRRGLLGTMELFAESHHGLLQGQPFLDLPETRNICVLKQMAIVTSLWNEFELLVRRVYYDGVVAPAVLDEVAVKNPVLLKEMNTAVGLYVRKPTDCMQEMTENGWRAVLREAGLSLSLIWQCAKLFLQVALAVDVTTSTTFLQVRFSQTAVSLRALIEGSVAKDIATPVTQATADAFITGWGAYAKFNENARQSLGSPTISTAEMERADGYAMVAMEALENGLNLYLQAAYAAHPQLPVGTAELASLLGKSVEKTVYEALKGRYLRDPATPARVRQELSAMEEWRLALLLGRPGEGERRPVNRTSNACTLRHMQDMTVVWNHLAHCARRFADNTSSRTDLHCIVRQAALMHDPVNLVMHDYISGMERCELQTTASEWETSVLAGFRIWALAERVLAEEALDMLGTVVLPDLEPSARELEISLLNLTLGCPECGVPSPPSEGLAQQLLLVRDVWDAHWASSPPRSHSQQMLAAAAALAKSYMTAAAAAAPSSYLERIAAAGLQCVRVEQLMHLATSMLPNSPVITEIQKVLDDFEETHKKLVEGTPGIPADQPGYMPPTHERLILPVMRDLWSLFLALKMRLEEASAAAIPTRTLSRIRFAKAALFDKASEAAELFVIARTLSQLRPVRILAPLPLSGTWMPGAVMRVAARVAEEVINEEQLLLPGMSLATTFVDDECSERQGMKVLLEQITSNNVSWVGIGGMACSSICAATATVATSMKLPVISYGCSSGDLSDPVAYSGFVRLATPLTAASSVIRGIARRYGWRDLVVYSANSRAHEQNAESLVERLRDSGLRVDWTVVDAWNQKLRQVKSLHQSRVRQVILVGNEQFCRLIACAAKITGIFPGMTWISTGLKSRGWHYQDDPVVISLDKSCTGVALAPYLDGMVNIVGTTEHVGQSYPFDCFKGHSRASFMQRIYNTIAISGEAQGGFYDDVAELAADGTCTFALVVRHMLKKGYSLDNLEKPGSAAYESLLSYLRGGLSFFGISGNVSFSGTDRSGHLAVWQILQNATERVGIAFANGSVDLDVNNGMSDLAWKPHPPDPPQPRFPWVAVMLPTMIFIVCSGVVAGAIQGWKLASRPTNLSQAPAGWANEP